MTIQYNKEVIIPADDVSILITRYLQEKLKDRGIVIAPSNIQVINHERTQRPQSFRITWKEEVK